MCCTIFGGSCSKLANGQLSYVRTGANNRLCAINGPPEESARSLNSPRRGLLLEGDEHERSLMSTNDAHASGAASTGLIEHLLSEIRNLRDTVSKLTSPGNNEPAAASAAAAAPAATGVHRDYASLFPAAAASAVATTATLTSPTPRRPAGQGDQASLADRLAAQTQILLALPASLRPKAVPLYHLPWVVQYALRLADGHQPFGVEDDEEEETSGGAAGVGLGGGRAAVADHVLIVKQWSDMFEAALVKHLSEDRFDTVNLQM